MSLLSNWLHKVGDYFTSAAQKTATPDQQSQLADLANKATGAAQAAEAALPTLAKIIVDDALAQIPGFGAYIPAFNDLLDVLAQEILSRKTKAA